MIGILVFLAAIAFVGFVMQICYRSISTDDDYYLPLRSILALKSIAPDKWRYGSISNCMFYNAGDESYTVQPTTWIGSLLLRRRMRNSADSLFNVAILKDIEEYQKKKEQEAEAEISRQQAELKSQLNILKKKDIDARLDELQKNVYPYVAAGKFGRIAAGKIDPSTIYTTTLDGRLSDLHEKINDLMEMIDEVT